VGYVPANSQVELKGSECEAREEDTALTYGYPVKWMRTRDETMAYKYTMSKQCKAVPVIITALVPTERRRLRCHHHRRQYHHA